MFLCDYVCVGVGVCVCVRALVRACVWCVCACVCLFFCLGVCNVYDYTIERHPWHVSENHKPPVHPSHLREIG